MKQPHIEYKIQSFEDLSTIELYNILKLRQVVFVVEQDCVYLDADDKDLTSHHFSLYIDRKLKGYARITPPGLRFNEVSFGRLAIHPDLRSQSFGKKLVEKLLENIHCLYPNENIKISAQLYLEKFYQEFDFSTCSNEYLEDNIPHIEMIKKALS